MRDGKLDIGKTDGLVSIERGGEENTLINNLYLSIAIRKGEWWLSPGFGLDLPRQARNLRLTPEITKAKVQDALEWILKAGRAVSIVVAAERPRGSSDRIDVTIRAVQADGLVVTYKTFVGVA